MFHVSITLIIVGIASIALGLSPEEMLSKVSSFEYPIQCIVRLDFVSVGIFLTIIGSKCTMRYIEKKRVAN